ncbi:MAG: tryptophan--tRNA ligase, partial [Proteobacteria bacterium]|nr:tryptophan--tRNA ligase [Pseudomonadota bacterium]
MKKIVLTGDRPTGNLHLGHYKGSLENRIALQEIHEQFIMIADIQALTDNFEDPEKVSKNVIEVMKGNARAGIDPRKSNIFIQSQIPEIAELTMYYMNLVSVGRLERNPTVKNEIQQKGFSESIPAGFLCYPVNQAADITIFKANLVPVGADQIPMIEQTNEIVRKFNRIYKTECMKECRAYTSSFERLTGIDGASKASKSLGNAIFLSDDDAMLRKKVFQMYTDPNHINISDPGKIEGNVVFLYLDAFYQNKEDLENLKLRYSMGGVGDFAVKELLYSVLKEFITPIRDMRNQLKNNDMLEILREGTAYAQKIASQTILEVRDAMKLMYF